MEWSEIVQYIVYAVVFVAFIFIAWGVKKFFDWFQKKTGITIAESTVNSVVGYIYQTFVEPIKKGEVVGEEWNKETMQEAFNQALEKTKELLSDKVKEALTKSFSNLDEYLGTLIEKAVSDEDK